MKICAIHQPNFFPWGGYFDKIRKSDIFIFLDEVAYPKSGSGSGSWCNRVKLLNTGQPSWYGLPIRKEHGVQLIKDVYFSNKSFHLNKLKKSLYYNYQKKDYYNEVMQAIEPIIDFETDSLAEYNMNAIKRISSLLGLNTIFIKQSDIQHTKHSTELLIELVKAVGADGYLCGNGADGYQEDGLFANKNIELIYQHYNSMTDPYLNIKNDSEKGLSILHSLFTNGFITKPVEHFKFIDETELS